MEASSAKYRFGGLSRIAAEAFGEPGKRTFRLMLESGAATASLWLEKQQLYQLASYTKEIVTNLPTSKAGEGEVPEPQWSQGITNLEVRVGKLALGHDSASNCFLVLAHDVEDPDEDTATVSFWLTLKQGQELAEEALKICAAGRPECPLCSQPIDPEGHMCPHSNGHGPLGETR